MDKKIVGILVGISVFFLAISQLVFIPVIVFLVLFLMLLLERNFRIEVEDYIFYLFIMIALVSSAFAKNKMVSFGGVALLLVYYIFFYVGRVGSFDVRGILWGAIVSIFLLTVMGVVFYIFPNLSIFIKMVGINFIEIPSGTSFYGASNGIRSPSITPSPVIFSSSVLYFLPLVLVYIFENFKNNIIFFWLSLLLIIVSALVVLVVSGSRSFLLLFPVIFFTILVIFRRYDIIIVFSIVFMFLLLVFWDYVYDSVIQRSLLAIKGGDYTSANNRFDAYRDGIKLFLQNPVIGIGLVNFKEYVPYYFGNYIHNLYLSILTETGVLGFISFFSFIGFSLFKGIEKLTKEFDSVKLGIVVSIITFLVHGLVDNTLYVFALGGLFWLFLGVLLRNKE